MCVARLFLQSSSSSSSTANNDRRIAAAENIPFTESVLVFTLETFAESLGSLLPSPLVETLVGLPQYDLLLFVSLARLAAKQSQAGIGSIAGKSSSSSNSSSGAGNDSKSSSNAPTLKHLLTEFDRLTGYLGRRQLSRPQVLESVRALASVGLLKISNPSLRFVGSEGHLNDESVTQVLKLIYDRILLNCIVYSIQQNLLMLPSPREVRAWLDPSYDPLSILTADSGYDGANTSWMRLLYKRPGSGGGMPRVKLSEAIRRSVLNPQEIVSAPLIGAAAGAGGIFGSMRSNGGTL